MWLYQQKYHNLRILRFDNFQNRWFVPNSVFWQFSSRKKLWEFFMQRISQAWNDKLQSAGVFTGPREIISFSQSIGILCSYIGSSF